ncbi:DUF4129 domain-containing protein [Modestobacter sp. DSM 44400]|uniref:DUF4129 domain-containing protein n=1 Tax=Modestobacter sp. DSM 44400 TaxID=1550230 RepID=UPI000B842742|nr:DUF4129 domain-containing protein [Modestobacter sp. DSM 44400]
MPPDPTGPAADAAARPGRPAGPPPGRRPLALAAVASAGIVAVLALAGLAARSGSYTRALPPDRSAAPTTYSPAPFTLPGRVAAVPATTAPAEPVNPVTGWVLLALILVVAAVTLAVLVRLAWRFFAGRAVRRRPDPSPLGPAPPVDAELPAAVERALLAVEQPDAREAVVRAWLLLGEAAAVAGTAARTSETATEYAERLAAVHRLPVPSVHRLAELYREARFSGHEVGAAQRDAARTELQLLRGALAGRPAQGAR